MALFSFEISGVHTLVANVLYRAENVARLVEYLPNLGLACLLSPVPPKLAWWHMPSRGNGLGVSEVQIHFQLDTKFKAWM